MKVNDHITWDWGNGTASGTIVKIFHKHVEITSKGKTITRNGTSNDPALEIKHNSGHKVLKLQSEVTKDS